MGSHAVWIGLLVVGLGALIAWAYLVQRRARLRSRSIQMRPEGAAIDPRVQELCERVREAREAGSLSADVAERLTGYFAELDRELRGA